MAAARPSARVGRPSARVGRPSARFGSPSARLEVLRRGRLRRLQVSRRVLVLARLLYSPTQWSVALALPRSREPCAECNPFAVTAVFELSFYIDQQSRGGGGGGGGGVVFNNKQHTCFLCLGREGGAAPMLDPVPTTWQLAWCKAEGYPRPRQSSLHRG